MTTVSRIEKTRKIKCNITNELEKQNEVSVSTNFNITNQLKWFLFSWGPFKVC